MPRATNSVASRARRKKILKMAKGYYGARKNVWSVAKNAVEKGLLYAYSGRKQRKRQFRSLWIHGLTQVHVSMECRTASSWANARKKESN